MHTSALHFRGVTGLASRRMGTEGVSKVMMIGGGTLVFSGFGGVAYTLGSVGTRWIWSAHVGVALSWRQEQLGREQRVRESAAAQMAARAR